MTPASEVDHLVVAAATLVEGIAWCRETLGFEPAAGGEHPLMGTHNRVFRVATPQYGRAYFEIIAINPDAPAPARARWFDMDQPRLRESIQRGPCLVHFVAAANDAAGALAALRECDIDRGPLVGAERETPTGLLKWKISVRQDGARLFEGVLPTLIEWESRHPTESMPESGVTLRSLDVTHPQAPGLQRAYRAIGLGGVGLAQGAANIVALLDTPKGPVRLESRGA
jgi:hypothetical protein